MLASYAQKREGDFSLEEIGLPAQLALFERAGGTPGRAPPVVEGQDVLADPRGALTALCAACGIAFDAAMLSWPPGRRASDGVWAPAWYDAVERSTGFAPAARARPGSTTCLIRSKPIAEAARPLYERLARHKLAPVPSLT